MSTLQQLAELRSRLLETMKDGIGWDLVQAELSALLAINTEAVAEEYVSELVKCFGLWNQEEMTGEGGQEPLAAVVFEWSSDAFEQNGREGFDAFANGYGKCVETDGSVYIPRPEYEFGEPRFGDCGGIEIGVIARLAPAWTEENENMATYFADLSSFRVAELVHHAMARASESESFAALNKRDELCILVRPHDRFAVLAYRWKR